MKTFFKLMFFRYDLNNVDTFPALFVSVLIWLGILIIIAITQINL